MNGEISMSKNKDLLYAGTCPNMYNGEIERPSPHVLSRQIW